MPQRSRSTTKQLHADLPVSIGLLVFRCGMSAQSLMARIILPRHACSLKHGAKFLAVSAPHWFSPFSLTKICTESATRSLQLLIQFSFQESVASAQLRRKN